jgi:aryl-alcohol dehydrogenase
MQITAALATANSTPLALDEVQLVEPGAGDILVRIVASGLCHTDLNAIAKAPLPWPAILGHEGAGIVEKIGPGVTKVAPGDHVIMTTSSCGGCANCQAGQPSYCASFRELNMSGGYRADGGCSHTHHGKPVFARFLGQSSFATYSLTWERNVIKVDASLPLDVLAPLGCGIQTGAGAVLNTLKVRPGSNLVVFGAGAVGLSALMAAKLSGCAKLIAVDMVPWRLDLARELGATDVVNARDGDSVEAVRALTGGGVDYAVEATGVEKVMEQAVASLGLNGTVVLVGMAGANASMRFNPTEVQSRNQTIKGSLMAGAGAIADAFIPQLIGFWKAGQLPIEKLVHYYDFKDINQAIHDAHDGSAIKPILRMPA